MTNSPSELEQNWASHLEEFGPRVLSAALSYETGTLISYAMYYAVGIRGPLICKSWWKAYREN